MVFDKSVISILEKATKEFPIEDLDKLWLVNDAFTVVYDERERESKRDERESMTVYRNADNEIQLVKSERGINDL